MRSPTLAALLLFVGCGPGGSAFVLSDADAGEADAGEVSISMVPLAGCGIQDGSTWWSEAVVTIDVARVRAVRAVLCDLEGTPPPDAAGLPCRITSEVAFSESRARVRCGEGDPGDGGHRYGTVRFVVE